MKTFVNKNEDIFSFNTHHKNAKQYLQQVKWLALDWSHCSVTCGEGVMSRKMVCVHAMLKETVPDELCEKVDKQATEKKCFLDECLAWKVEKWSECSVTCGTGVKHRSVRCQDVHRCSSQHKPASSAECTLSPCVRWVVGEWSECSKSCDRGIKSRSVMCVGAPFIVLPHVFCKHRPRPSEVRLCQTTACLPTANEMTRELLTAPYHELKKAKNSFGFEKSEASLIHYVNNNNVSKNNKGNSYDTNNNNNNNNHKTNKNMSKNIFTNESNNKNHNVENSIFEKTDEIYNENMEMNYAHKKEVSFNTHNIKNNKNNIKNNNNTIKKNNNKIKNNKKINNNIKQNNNINTHLCINILPTPTCTHFLTLHMCTTPYIRSQCCYSCSYWGGDDDEGHDDDDDNGDDSDDDDGSKNAVGYDENQ